MRENGPEVVLAARSRHESKSSQNWTPRPRVFIGTQLKLFAHLLPFKGYSKFSFWLETPLWRSNFKCFWVILPQNVKQYQCSLQKALPYIRPRRLNHQACQSDAPFGLGARLRNQKIKKKVYLTFYFTNVWGRHRAIVFGVL
jgi:hypothetical protein